MPNILVEFGHLGKIGRQFVLVTDSRSPLHRLVKSEMEGESGAVSQEHARVAPKKAPQTFLIIYTFNFCPVTHLFIFLVLRANLQQIEDKCHIGIASTHTKTSLKRLEKLKGLEKGISFKSRV